MIINHPLYGRFNITEPVLIELIKSPALQRLKKINQYGAWSFHHLGGVKFSRYRHSLGVMLLLRRFGAPLEEQIAGLLHDISHTAFSHVADRVFGRELKQDYQDTKLEQAFELQGINVILMKHRISPGKILDFSKFTLLEKNLPHLCADRLDYTFEDQLIRQGRDRTRKIISGLTVFNHQFVFSNLTEAKKFSLLYLNLNKIVWCNPLNSALYKILADAIRLGLQSGIIEKKDLFTTDQDLIKKLRMGHDTEITGRLRQLKNLKIRRVSRTQADVCLRSKVRIIDPSILINKKLIRLSAVDSAYGRKIVQFKKMTEKGFCIKIINP